MSLIAGERKPSPHSVSILGDDVATTDRWKEFTGWVPQRATADPGQRTSSFVRDVAWLRGLNRSEATFAARQAIETVGLSEVSNQRVRTLSGGMHKRMMIAAGIVRQPKVLLLDEPTAGLDPNHRSSIVQQLKELAVTGTTVLMTTHIAADVEEADRALFLDGGNIAADHTVSALLSQHHSIDDAFRRFTSKESPA